MRLIDADALLEELKKSYKYLELKEYIVSAPTIDAKDLFMWWYDRINDEYNIKLHGELAETSTFKEKHQLSEETPTNTPTDTPTDTISRAEAIETVTQMWKDDEIDTFDGMAVQRKLSALPSADAVSREDYDQMERLYDAIRIYERNTGEWHDSWGFAHCSICGQGVQRPIGKKTDYKFCPFCGADMRGGGSE